MSFTEKIKKYLELTKEESAAKKAKEPIAKELKDHVRTLDGKILLEEGFEVTLSDRGSVADDVAIVKILKKLKRKDLIKKVELPDHEKLEKAIYDQEIDGSLFASAVTAKQKDVLSVKAVKVKENEDGEN